MKIIDCKQNSKEWRGWRDKGLGASNAAVILGISPWSTPFQLWLELTGLCERPEPNPFALAAMKRGNDLEPEARKRVEKQLGKKFPALSAEHDEYPFIRASFDGVNLESKELIEIKCAGKEDHGKALKGIVPDKYIAQIQQQLLVSGFDKCWYASWDGKSEEVVLVLVEADPAYEAQLIKALSKFWTYVQTRIPPAVEPDDMKVLRSRVDADLKRLVNSQKALSLALGGDYE